MYENPNITQMKPMGFQNQSQATSEKTRRDYPRSPADWLDAKHAECLSDIRTISERLRCASTGDETIFLLRQARGAYAELDHIRRLRSAMPNAEEFGEPEYPSFMVFRAAHIEMICSPPMYALELLNAA